MKKKMIQSLLVASLAFGMAVSPVTPIAFAAETGTITVQDTQKGATYTPYKIFDAEVADSSMTDIGKDGVSYMIPQGKETMYQSSTGFTDLFTTSTTGGRTYVSKKEGVSDVAIATWAKTISSSITAGNSVTESGVDGTEIISGLDYGYYYIKSSINNGSTVMVTSVSPNATIHEKNSTAGWGQNGGKTVDRTSYSVGDKVTYTITYENAVNYNGSSKVYQYVLDDTMPAQNVVDLDEGSYTVTVTSADGVSKTLSKDNGTISDKNGTYTVSELNNNFKLTIPWAATKLQSSDSNTGGKDDFYYSGVNKIIVTYTGVLKSKATPGSGTIEENTNTAKINPNEENSDSGQKVSVNDGKITIKKIDGADSNKVLEGATFIVKNSQGEFLDYSDSENVKWTTDQSKATPYRTDSSGTVSILGLASGTYKLVETKAPAGYNLMTDETPVELKLGAEGNQDTLLVTSTVKNNKGTELPSTGGIGTTIFYIIGAILVIGAGIVLVARRRLRS